MRVKYNSEGRFSFGVGVDVVMKIENDGSKKTEKKGFRVKPFDYTETVLLSAKDFDKKVQEEIKRVRDLKNGKGWVQDTAIKDVIYKDDDITRLKDVGPATSRKFHELNIMTVWDLKTFPRANVGELHKKFGDKYRRYFKEAETCIEINRPDKRDFRKDENPYEARYGDSWRQEIRKVSALSPYTDIRLMIDHIAKETKKAGKKYFYHDAL